VTAPQGPWRAVEVLDEVDSTNRVLRDRAVDGVEPGLVVVAEHQTHGRGRLDRLWESPRSTGLTFSVLLRPSAPRSSWGWLPLLAGLAVAETLTDHVGLDATVKWPNDVLIDDRKVAGLLVEAVAHDGAVIGIGVNTHLEAEALPTPVATSLILEGAPADAINRASLLTAVLLHLHERMADLDRGPTAEAMAAYRMRCSTLGRHVDITVPGGQRIRGTVADIADDASLVIDVDGHGVRHVAAGDVVHLR
jgi:BirA family biotin operon repressor/biotin-[acetyl-CoA-carboxylase] ligase